MEMIKVGKVVGAHSLKGEIKVASLTDFDELRWSSGSRLYVETQSRWLEVSYSRQHKGIFVVKLNGVDDRNAAENMIGSYLAIKPEQLTKLPPEEYYHFQLIGLDVYEEEKYYGKIAEILPTGANDVYVVRQDGQDLLLPAIRDVIKNVDLAAGRMEVKLLPGLAE